jgi:hypothetical protein
LSEYSRTLKASRNTAMAKTTATTVAVGRVDPGVPDGEDHVDKQDR